MATPIYLVDAFARGPFTGNPAGVCVLDKQADSCWMRQLAMEMNQAETAYVWPMEGGFGLKWFTPELEVDLCGHATMATTHVLFETGRLKEGEKAVFHTLSGQLVCDRVGNRIRMDFPAVTPIECEPPPGLLDLIPGEAEWIGQNRMDCFVVLRSAGEVRKLELDFQKLAKIKTRGVIFTAKSDDPEFDFVSRFFAPSVGVPEDPATGSAHCGLGPFWAERLGKKALRAFQASKRGGYVTVDVLENDRVYLGGEAAMVFEGALR